MTDVGNAGSPLPPWPDPPLVGVIPRAGRVFSGYSDVFVYPDGLALLRTPGSGAATIGFFVGGVIGYEIGLRIEAGKNAERVQHRMQMPREVLLRENPKSSFVSAADFQRVVVKHDKTVVSIVLEPAGGAKATKLSWRTLNAKGLDVPAMLTAAYGERVAVKRRSQALHLVALALVVLLVGSVLAAMILPLLDNGPEPLAHDDSPAAPLIRSACSQLAEAFEDGAPEKSPEEALAVFEGVRSKFKRASELDVEFRDDFEAVDYIVTSAKTPPALPPEQVEAELEKRGDLLDSTCSQISAEAP